MFFLRVFAIFVLASSTLGQGTAPYESELSTPADRLVHEIELRKLADRLADEIALPRKHAPTSLKILVLDFPNQRGIANVLGERMSERLSGPLDGKTWSRTCCRPKPIPSRLALSRNFAVRHAE
jgi:hypothetical protein